MTAIVLPDIDLDELRKSIPSLAEIDLPSLAKAGARADQALDSWRGKSRAPTWPWVAAGVFVLGLIGTLVALVSWSRRTDALSGTAIPSQPYGSETYSTESVSTESWPSTESTPT